MTTNPFKREVLHDGRWQLSAGRTTFTCERLRAGALMLTICGVDTGQFSTAPLDEIRLEMLRYRPVELLINAEAAVAVSVSVSKEWTAFFSLNRDHLKRVSVLVGSKAIQLTVEIAQHLSQTGNLIQIYLERDLFRLRVGAARL